MSDRSTRVTFVGPVPPITGGIASHSACLLRALADCEIDVHVISWESQYPKRLFKGSGIDASAAPYPGAEFSLRWWDPTSWLRAGRRAAGTDLLIMPWVTPVHAIPQRIIEAMSHAPLSLLVHNAVPHERMPFDARLASWVMGRASQIVVHAQSVAADVRALAPSVPVAVVPLPTQLPVEPAALPDPPPPLRLLCLGFVRRYKGFDLALDALRVLRDRGVDARLTIAGEVWEDAGAWTKRVNDPEVKDAVTFVDRYVPNAELVQILREHHIVLAPYRSATQSGVLPLALAAGRPVVATDVGGLREALRDGVDGRLVPVGDVPALSDAIEEVAKDLDGYAARAASTSLSWSDVARALLAPIQAV